MKELIKLLIALLTGNVYFYLDNHWTPSILRNVFYRYDEEWDHHVFECPSLDWTTTVAPQFTKSEAWNIAHRRLEEGLH